MIESGAMTAARTASFDAAIAAPFGTLGVRLDGARIDEIVFLPAGHAKRGPVGHIARSACEQLLAYLADPTFVFDLPVVARGTPFQRRVWRALTAIPCGHTRTYGDVANELGSSARAVGQACGDNPLPLVVPCHRVVSAAGLGGFAHRDEGFTLSAKRWLLAHEARTRALLA
jgi:methylated-DNA-[protein]-cysteine S-methyltransferase